MTTNIHTALATDTVVVPAIYSCILTPVLVATVDMPIFVPATVVGGSLKDAVVVPTIDFVATITDFVVPTSSFVGTTIHVVDLIAVASVGLSATGLLHIEEISFEFVIADMKSNE